MHRSTHLALLSLLLISPLSACSDAVTTGPTPQPSVTLEGTYRTTVFTTTTRFGTIDRIAEGLTMTLTLSGDRSLVGLVFTPTGSAVVTGTWDTTNALVTFHEEAASFLHQIPFQIQPDGLHGEALVGVATYRITMKKD